MTRFLYIFLLLLLSKSTFASERFVAKGELITTLPLELKSGYLFITLPIEDTNSSGQSITHEHSFLIDPAITGDGNYVPLDSNPMLITSSTVYSSPVTQTRSILLNLVPTEARENFRTLKPNFMGVLGYGFLKRYRTVFDFVKMKMFLYGRTSDITYAISDSNLTMFRYNDDAIISYCSCPFPTMWLDVKAPPIKEGRVHLALADNQSIIFREALDAATLKIIESEEHADSLTGKNNFAGIRVGQFVINGTNIAGQNPKRVITKRPAKFKDLNIEVIGTLSMDVLRTYQAMIIDPSANKLMLIK